MHLFRFERTVKDFNVSTATINVLLMLDSKLDNEILIFVAKRRELSAQSIEPSILRCLNTCNTKNVTLKSHLIQLKDTVL